MLLDTHVLVWLALGDPRLKGRTRVRIDQGQRAQGVFVSAISFWEIGMLVEKKRLELDPEMTRSSTLRAGIRELPVDGAIALYASRLVGFHGDPADRLLVATALASGLPLVTADRRLLRWKGLETIDATR